MAAPSLCPKGRSSAPSRSGLLSCCPGFAHGALAVVIALGSLSCSSSRNRRAEQPGASYPAVGGPSWLPPYTRAQQELLMPVKSPIQVPARRVFPDLARFAYAPNRRLDDPIETVKFTKLVASVLLDSPRFYQLDKANDDDANTIAQYGPPGEKEPDGFMTVTRDDRDIGHLTPAPLSKDSRSEYERALPLQAKGDHGGASTLL